MVLLRRLLCAVRGHDPFFALDDVGPFLKCASCSYRSTGFDARPSPRLVRWLRFQRRLAS